MQSFGIILENSKQLDGSHARNAHNSLDTELASSFSCRDYKEICNRQPPGREAIAEAIHRRFSERYIEPISAKPHGFTIMAASCLMIEALETFRQGWESSNRLSKEAFCLFFDASEPFKDFREHAQTFYTHVRCGILHQAETTGGWRIRRDGPLLDVKNFTINANLFLFALRQELNDYCDMLKAADWEGTEWKNARRKLNAIVENCRTPIDSQL